jgi:hypothetical protein
MLIEWELVSILDRAESFRPQPDVLYLFLGLRILQNSLHRLLVEEGFQSCAFVRSIVSPTIPLLDRNTVYDLQSKNIFLPVTDTVLQHELTTVMAHAANASHERFVAICKVIAEDSWRYGTIHSRFEGAFDKLKPFPDATDDAANEFMNLLFVAQSAGLIAS